MNRKKLLQLIMAASAFAGGMSLTQENVQAIPMESNTNNIDIMSDVRSVKKGKVVNISTNLRIRSEADINSNVIGYLNNGAIVDIIGESGNWYKVSFNGKNGYASKDYISVDNNSNSSNGSYEKGRVINVTSGLRIRQSASTGSAILGTLHNGDVFDIIAKSGQWYNIKSGGIVGFIHGDYVQVVNSGSSEESRPAEKPSSSNGKVVNITSNLRVRSAASTNSSTLGYLVNGQGVNITGETGNWYKIDFKGTTGYVSKDYIQKTTDNGSNSNGQTGNNNGNPQVNSEKGYVVNVQSTLNVRSGAGSNHNIIGHLSNGDKVDIIGESGSWYKIKFNGSVGYVSKDYINKGHTSDSNNNNNNNNNSATEVLKGYVVNVHSTLNIRAEASTSSEVLGVLYNKEEVDIIGENGDWYIIKFDGKRGYVSKEYISKVKPEDSNSSNNGSSSGVATKKMGQVHNVESNLRVRSDASIDSMVLGYLMDGERVEIIGEKGNWYKILFRGKPGYVSKDYMKIVDATTSNPSSTYERVLSAMKEHLGSPYVWGGSGEYLTTSLLDRLKTMYPSQTNRGAYVRAERYANKGYRAFDCSGLMQW